MALTPLRKCHKEYKLIISYRSLKLNLCIMSNLCELPNCTLNNNLTNSNNEVFRFGYDAESGKRGYIVTEEGADTFYPFKQELRTITYQHLQNYEGNSGTIQIPCDFEKVIAFYTYSNRTPRAFWNYLVPDAIVYANDNRVYGQFYQNQSVILDTDNHILSIHEVRSYGTGNGDTTGINFVIAGY